MNAIQCDRCETVARVDGRPPIAIYPDNWKVLFIYPAGGEGKDLPESVTLCPTCMTLAVSYLNGDDHDSD